MVLVVVLKRVRWIMILLFTFLIVYCVSYIRDIPYILSKELLLEHHVNMSHILIEHVLHEDENINVSEEKILQMLEYDSRKSLSTMKGIVVYRKSGAILSKTHINDSIPQALNIKTISNVINNNVTSYLQYNHYVTIHAIKYDENIIGFILLQEDISSMHGIIKKITHIILCVLIFYMISLLVLLLMHNIIQKKTENDND